MAAPTFVITDAGLAVASTAGPSGPYIEIHTFRVGNGVGYTPLPIDNALHGALLYEGTPTGYSLIGLDTINVVCELPMGAGPFQFGEIGLFLADGTLFALAAFESLQEKYSSNSSGIPHVVRYNCLLKLAQTPAVFEVTNLTQLNLLELPTHNFLAPSPSMANNPNAAILAEANSFDEPTLFVRKNSTEWSPVGWHRFKMLPVHPTLTTTTVLAVNEDSISRGLWYYTESYRDRKMLVRTQQGFVRRITAFNNGFTTENGYAQYYSRLTVSPALPAVANNDYGFCTFFVDEGRTTLARERVYHLWRRLNRLIGAPSFTNTSSPFYHVNNDGFGYGLATLTEPTTGNEPTALQWQQLIDMMERIESLQNPDAGSKMVLPPGATNTSGQYVHSEYQREMNPFWSTEPETTVAQIEERLNRIISNRNKVHRSKYEYVVARAASRTYTATSNYWQVLQVSTQVSWGSVPVMTAFFNAGGYVDFNIRSTVNSYLEWMLNYHSMILGPVRFGRFGVETMGPQRLKFRYGDGYKLAAGPLGLQGLVDGLEHRMLHVTVPLNVREELSTTPGGYGKGDECLIFELYATGLTGGRINFRFQVIHTTFEYGNNSTPVGVANPGFVVATPPTGTVAADNWEDPNSYLSQTTDWDPPAQKANFYMYFGRPQGLGIGYPSVSSFTSTNWGTDITGTATTGFGGAGSAVE